jgi:hypothetical protein
MIVTEPNTDGGAENPIVAGVYLTALTGVIVGAPTGKVKVIEEDE